MQTDSTINPPALIIEHVMLTSGKVFRQSRDELRSDELAEAQAWLRDALAKPDDIHRLPRIGAQGYTAAAEVKERGLKVTIYGRARAEVSAPVLVTFAVGLRPQARSPLWDAIVAMPSDYPVPPAPIPSRPRNAWCINRLHRALIDERAVAARLSEFEKLIAWAWADLHAESLGATLH